MTILDDDYLNILLKQFLKEYKNISSFSLTDQERICGILGNYVLRTHNHIYYPLYLSAIKLTLNSSYPNLWSYKIVALYFKYDLVNDTQKKHTILSLLNNIGEKRVINFLPK